MDDRMNKQINMLGLLNMGGNIQGDGNGIILFVNHVDHLQYINFIPHKPHHEQSGSREESEKKTHDHDHDDNSINAIVNIINRYSVSSFPSTSTSTSTSTTPCKFKERAVIRASNNKRAVLCAVTYFWGGDFTVTGTIHDVNAIQTLLVTKFGFPFHNLRVLTEKNQDPNLTPTKRNIVDSMKWLVKDCQSGDSLVFYFSGPCLPKGFTWDDICPLDYMKQGTITGEDINSLIVRPLKKGVTLHAILDSCHTETAFDLSYVYRKQGGLWKWEDNKTLLSKEPTSGGLAICIRDCSPYVNQNLRVAANEAFCGNLMNGLMTSVFIETIREHSELTYGAFLEKMQERMQKITSIPNRLPNFLQPRVAVSEQRNLGARLLQSTPKVLDYSMLSSSEIFDVSTTLFTL